MHHMEAVFMPELTIGMGDTLCSIGLKNRQKVLLIINKMPNY
jgi:hypothetical protein